MHLSFNQISFASITPPFSFKNRFYSSLTPLQNRIFLIFSAVISALAASFAIWHYFLKTKIVNFGNKTNKNPLTNADKLLQFVKEKGMNLNNFDLSLLGNWVENEERIIKLKLNNGIFVRKEEKEFTHFSLDDIVDMIVMIGKDIEDINLSDLNFHKLKILNGPHITDEQLQRIIKACPNLRALNLMDCFKITDAGLKDLPPNLERLHIRNVDQLTGSALNDLPKNLKKLLLKDCNKLVPDACLQKLPGKLFILELNHCDQLGKDSLQKLPCKLRVLRINHCSSLTDSGLQNLPRNLRSLSLNRCPNLTDANIQNLPPHLKKLFLFGCTKITDAAIKGLPPHIVVVK